LLGFFPRQLRVHHANIQIIVHLIFVNGVVMPDVDYLLRHVNLFSMICLPLIAGLPSFRKTSLNYRVRQAKTVA
jgi:hypothetical protein